MSVLAEESDDHLKALINLLEDAGSEWSQPVETSQAWDRPAVAFYVIFQSDESDEQAVLSRLENVGASVSRGIIIGK